MNGRKNPLHAEHGEGDRSLKASGGGVIFAARKLRKDLSLPGVLLWQRLRRNPQGVKFRRQHPVGPYVLDFYCAKANLAIEIDGEAHNRGDRPSRDEARDLFLISRGLKVLRIPATDILKDADIAAEAIIAVASPLHHSPAASGPPPHAAHGEDFLGATS